MKHVTIALLATITGGLAVGAVTVSSSLASGGEAELHKQHWHFDGIFGKFDRAAQQRGYKVYREVCANCHAMKYMAFRNLGQKGGPFFNEHYPNPNDNPIVKVISSEYDIEDGPDDEGSMFMRTGFPSDYFASPFANDNAARAANGGALPPDLSLITKARAHGPDYVYGLMTGYLGEGEQAPHDVHVSPGMYYNAAFAGQQIAMAPPMMDGMIAYDDGSSETVEQYAKDVVEFLHWAAEPKLEERKELGFMVMIYLFIFLILVYLSYKKIWRDVEH